MASTNSWMPQTPTHQISIPSLTLTAPSAPSTPTCTRTPITPFIPTTPSTPTRYRPWPSQSHPYQPISPPAPLATHLNRWLYLSLLLSLSVPLTLAYTRLYQRVGPHASSNTSNSTSSESDSNASSNSSGGYTTEPFALGLTLVSILYALLLLLLARRERSLASRWWSATAPTCSCSHSPQTTHSEHPTAENPAVLAAATSSGRMRGTISLLMVAICQSFLAALFLYVGVRVTFLLRATHSAVHVSMGMGVCMAQYVDFVLVGGQMVVMGYIVFRCVVHEARMEAYLVQREMEAIGDESEEMREV